MAIKIGLEGYDVQYTLSPETTTDNISIKNDSGDLIKITTMLELANDFENKPFEIHFLAKSNLKENDIFQVYSRVTKARIGWLIPVISLDSNLHDKANDIHFQRYAYMAIRNAISAFNHEECFSPTIDSVSEEIPFSSLFHESTALLILSQETFSQGFSFNIDRAMPSLVKHGYVKLSKANPDNLTLCGIAPEENRIYLENISKHIDSTRLISQLLSSTFAYESTPAFKFFFLYQIIELLMEEVYKHQQQEIVTQLVDSYGDLGKTKELLEKISASTSEKKRMELLICQYSKISDDTANLKKVCNNLLIELNREKEEHFQGFLYKIRNFIFHQYRDFPEDKVDMLNEVSNELLYILPKLLETYAPPEKALPELPETNIPTEGA